MWSAAHDTRCLDAEEGTCEMVSQGRGVKGCQLGQGVPRAVRDVRRCQAYQEMSEVLEG